MTRYYSLASRELLDNMAMPTFGENFRVLGVVLPGIAMSVVEIEDSDAPESYEGAMIVPTFKTETKSGRLKIYINDRSVLPDDHFVDQMSAPVSKILEWVNEKRKYRSKCSNCGEELTLVNGFSKEEGHFMALVCLEHGVLSRITKSSDD